jgi:hypothetical protein
MNYLIPIPLIFALLSCRPNENKVEEPQKIKVTQYQLWLSRLDTVDSIASGTFILDTSSSNGKNEYNLKLSSDDSLSVFKYSIAGDSLFYEDQYCKVIDTIELTYKGANFQMFISDFDQVDFNDEESYIFWNSQYGMLGQYNWVLGPVLLFEPSSLNGFSTILYDYIVARERLTRL